MERRLAAVLAADVVGYSRLMGADETGTVERLKSLRKGLVQPRIDARGGRIVKLMGDGLLAEFASVVEAVECAIEIQQALTEHQAELPPERRIALRIGINLGDIIVDGTDIYGDGVNVAARLEGLAKPSGICVSGKVYEELRDRTDLPFEDLGEREVKNIGRPVRVWQWNPDGSDPTGGTVNVNEPSPIPDKASIAVLPLDNLSDSRDYEYLADGITEDIITLLARIPSFFVIARNSTFSYKGRQRDIRQVGRELGVRYVVEGSLRPVGERVRVTVQLIEAESGKHVWAERFERAAADLVDVQDEITNAIVTRLEPELTRAEFELIRRRPPSDLGAWTYYVQASSVLSLKGWHERTFAEGAELYRKAIALDPDFAPAHAALSLLLAIGHMIGHVSEPDEALAEADRALALDSDSSEVLGFAGCALSDLGHTTRGIEILERAIDRDPSNAQAWVALGAAQLTTRQPERAIATLEHGLRISPLDNRLAVWIGIYALALGWVGRLEEAIEQARLACRRDDKLHNPRVVLAALLETAGRTDEAVAALAEARRIRAKLSLREVRGIVGGRYAKALEKIWEL
ncbi:MAG: adenylate/guanylate cyclase domain-containing protein [Kiloniellales bacterium]|nr:adenylate/guanylate cyclase domain-containing protein [Kiloniellales bacterium]